MKKWMNWLLVISIAMVVLSGITIVFATNSETTQSEIQDLKMVEIYANPYPYKIQAGDSLWDLTANYAGQLDRQELILEIMAYNEIEDSSKIQINHVIYLPDCLSLHD